MIAILALLLLPIALCSPINVTKFDTKPGIFFEQIGSVKLSTTNWNIIVYYDLELYQKELNFLSIRISNLRALCDRTKGDTTCSFLVEYFEEVRESLKSKFNLITVKRTKRGAVDIVGNVANSLFGVLDSNYETKMSETIHQLRSNDNHLESLLKNQTSLIDSTINIMKKNQLSTKAKLDEIDRRLNSQAFGAPITEVQIASAILTLTVQMFTMVSTLQRAQTSIMDVLIDSHHGKINPLLLTPTQLTNEIIKIKSFLPQQLQLPIETNDLLHIYKLLTVDGIVAEDHIIFTMQLPLSDTREFQIFYLIPIIAVLNNTLVTVKSTTHLLAISPHRDDFFSLSETQLDACLQL